MKLIAPDYYNLFKCIASECRHSCCIGWEIDIDDETLEVYDGAKGSFGERLSASIERTEEGAHFRLAEDERCPFLNEKGLCDLIIEMGEENLCQICADHPRFRNFLSDRIETGLGLCCEAAGKIIISKQEKMELAVLEDDGGEEDIWEDETEALEIRRSILDILQDRRITVNARIDGMMNFCGVEAPALSWREIADMLMALERLDPVWERYINLLDAGDPAAALSGEEWEIAFEQLAVYFIYRHFIGAAEDGDFAGRMGFAALSVHIIRRMCEVCAAANEGFGIDDLVEIARMYSSEIEYSEENLEALMALFRRCENA